ncbi:MAG: metallophosphoesterase family protein [Bacillota bacterium]
MAEFSFIHTADVHLGSTIQLLEESISEQEKELLAEANFNAFANLTNIAIEQEVDFILVAGDLYDQEQRSIKANQFFNQQCRKLKDNGISIYIIAGNHDAINAKQELFKKPDNLVEFSSQQVEEYQFVKQEESISVNLMGQSYHYSVQREPLHLNYHSNNYNYFNIALLHTQLEANNSNYSPASKKELVANNVVDYWALGHIHQCQIKNDANPVIAYPGIPQGRDFGEEGLGGCLIVSVEQNQQINYNFAPTSDFVWRRVEIDIEQAADEINNLEQLLELIQKRAQDLSAMLPSIPDGLTVVNNNWEKDFKGYIVEWVITGATKMHQILSEQSEEAAGTIVNRLNQLNVAPYSVVTTGVKFKTTPPLPSLKKLADESRVFAELKQLINSYEKCEKKDLAENLGMIWQEEVDPEETDPTRFQLTAEAYQNILKEAKNLIIAELMERRD